MKARRLYMLGTSILFLLITGCQKDKRTNDLNGKTKTVSTKIKIPSTQKHSNIQEEKDWEELNTVKTFLFADDVESDNYYNGTFWHQRMFEEKIYKNRLRLANNFLRNYPESNNHFEATKIFFNPLLEPHFLKNDLTNKKWEIIDQKTETGKRYKSQLYQKFRALPFDIETRNKWIVHGDSLANSLLISNTSSDNKALIEVAVLGRDLRMAKDFYQYLYLDKKEEEAEFWFLFDSFFWKEFIDRIDKLMFKYPNYHRWPALVDQIVFFITEDYLSPELTESYWTHFYEVTNQPDIFEKHPIIKEVHNRSKENLKAIKVLESFDESHPLQMQMIGMDGKEINLDNYRGKVVMLDFWDLRCAPCIKEMPYVQTLYEKYKDQGFEVIGICAAGDKSKERVQEIIHKQGAKWPQVLDKSTNASISYHTLYKINRLPTVWLLNKNGVIVDKHARGNRLEPLIKKYLHLE